MISRSASGSLRATPRSAASGSRRRNYGFIEAALRAFGDLHILVCCAGILLEHMIFNVSEEDWDTVIAVHLEGHPTVMQATAQMRAKRAGRTITFTSTAGLDGSPGQSTEGALFGLTRSSALATANTVSP